MGYLDYTLQKLNAINQMNEQRYREKRLEEETKSQFLNSLVGLVPQAISGISDAADKRAVEEDALNKLRLQEALLTGGDNTLAGVRPLTGANTLAPTAKGPVAAAPAAANTFGFVNTPIEEEDNSLPGSERLASSGSDGGKGPPTDTSPGYNPYAELSGTIEPVAGTQDNQSTEKAADMLIRAKKAAENEAANEAAARAQGYDSYLDYKLKTQYPIDAGSVAPTVDPALTSSLSKLAPGLTAGIRSMGNTSAFPNLNVTTPDIGPSSPVDLSLREREGAVVPGEIPVPAARPVVTVPPVAVPPVAAPIVDPLAKLGAPAPAPLPLPAPAPTSLLQMTGRGGPAMPGAVGDENVPDESSKAYRKRMEKKGYSTQKINDLSKKYFGSSTGTIDIADETGTAGGPRGAKPFQIGGDNPPTFSGGGSGGFGGGPVADKPWIKAKKTTAPTTVAEEAKATAETGKTPIDRLRDEERVKSEDFNKRVRTYKRIGNADFKEPNVEKLAEKAVNEIFTKRPAGNPITEMINRMSGGNQMTSENERIMRSIAKKTIMKNIIAERTAIADKDQAEFLATAKLELDAATAQGKSLGLTTTKKQIPNSARLELDSQREADTMLNDVRDKAYQIAEKSGTLPFGPGRFLTEARIKKAAGVIGSSADSVSGGFLGLSAGQSKARALELDQGLLSQAFQAMDFSDLPADQQELLQLTKQSVQILGKAREGGKLTDADYMKYLETLFNSSNPAGFVRSLEETIDRNANRYNNNLEYFNTNYGDDLRMYESGGRREQGADIDWNQVKETPLGEAAAGMSPVASSGGTKKTGGSTPKKNKPMADD